MVFSKNNVKMFKWNHQKQANGFTALTVFDVHVSWSFSEKREQEREKHQHHAISMVWPLIHHSSQPVSVWKLVQLLKKKHDWEGDRRQA